MQPDFARFEQAYQNKIHIVEVNVDDRVLAEKYRKFKTSNYIPETVVAVHDRLVVHKDGVMTEADLEKAVGEALSGGG